MTRVLQWASTAGKMICFTSPRPLQPKMCSFLVADQVYVASIPPKSAAHPNPQQYVFSSASEDNEFQLFPDPRGNTLHHGTEITLVLKEETLKYLDVDLLEKLVYVHL